jgi:sulfite exporter TauE/SafE
MIELPLVLVAGVLGSTHCIGMCGPFALAIGAAAPDWKRNVGRQLTYGCGRIFTYTFLGASAGFGGMALASRLSVWTRLPAVLSIVAGVFLLYQGLLATGVLPRRIVKSTNGCLAASFFAGFIKNSRRRDVFLAGLMTGFLPCGLVYAFLAMAASSGSMTRGLLTMMLFGLGTMPVMVATGCGSVIFSWQSLARLMRVAAWAVVVAGCICVARGIGFLPLPGWGGEPACPLCP